MTPKLKGEVSRSIGFTWGRSNLWDKVTVSIAQVGGDLSLISNLLGATDGPGKAMVECSAKSFEKCKEYIEKILNAPNAYKAFEAKPASIGYQITTYADRPPVAMDAQNRQKRDNLVGVLSTNREDAEAIDSLLADNNVIGWHRDAIVKRIKPIVDRNIALLSKALEECDNPTYSPAPPCLAPKEIKGYSTYFGRDTAYRKAPELQPHAGHISNIDSESRIQQSCQGYIVGVAGKFGDSLDKVGFICQGPSDFPVVGEGHRDYVASKARKIYFDGENSFKTYCDKNNPNSWIVTGLRGNAEDWRGYRVVGSLGLWCTHIDILKGLKVDPALTNRFVPIFGTDNPNTQAPKCAPHFAVKSLDIWYGALIDGIRVDCVKVPKGF
jgi:hypothetical protein